MATSLKLDDSTKWSHVETTSLSLIVSDTALKKLPKIGQTSLRYHLKVYWTTLNREWLCGWQILS